MNHTDKYRPAWHALLLLFTFLMASASGAQAVVPQIAGGNGHTVALKSDGTVVAWGGNGNGQTTIPAGLTGVTAIAAGHDHTVALKSDGTVVAWGGGTTNTGMWPNYGQSAIPAGLTGVTAIAAGYSHTVALKSDGTVVAWGDNGHGQTTIPAGLTGVTAIAAGDYHTVALKSDGTVVAWGNNFDGRTTIPAGLTGVTAIAAGGTHTVALKSDGTVVAWGNNFNGQTTIPAGLTGVTAIAAGSSHTVALKSDGTVVAWGYNGIGQTTIPAGLTGVTAIAAGYLHTVALKSDGTVVAWGYNGNGQSTIPAGLNLGVADAVPPVVTAPVDIYVSAIDIYGTPASNTLITSFLSHASANDAVDGAMVPTNNAPVTFPIGTTLVTFTATDASGNTATATANVTVQSLASSAINNMANGTTLAGTSQTFSWTDTGASAYRLLVGATFGGSGYFDSYSLAAGTTSVVATGLPEKGVPVYVRLYAWVGGVWVKTDSSYVGANKPLATVTTPANGTTLAATSQTFSWTDTGADKYFLAVGNFAVGGADLYSSGILPAGTTSVTVNGLPNNGSTVYVRLFTWGNGAWQTSDTSYVAMPSTANVNNITNGATLAGTTQTFTWADTGAPMYYFIVGTAPGLGDIHQSGNLAAGTASANVTGLPAGGVPVYVRLYSWGNGSWNTSNTTYTAAP